MLPIQRLGFDVKQILQTAVDVIDVQRQGQRAPAVTRIAAILGKSAS